MRDVQSRTYNFSENLDQRAKRIPAAHSNCEKWSYLYSLVDEILLELVVQVFNHRRRNCFCQSNFETSLCENAVLLLGSFDQ